MVQLGGARLLTSRLAGTLAPPKTGKLYLSAHHFELNDGTEVDGFVIQEAANAVTIRTIAAEEQRIPVSAIAKREKRELSLMP